MEFVKQTRKDGSIPVRWKSKEPWGGWWQWGLLSAALPKPDGWAGLPLKEQACNRP